ncbi:hypothetical protein RUND412_009019 [Rhizina undulata]
MAPCTIKNVALIGATGNIGNHILAALRASDYHVAVLTRGGSAAPQSLPADVKVVTVDYNNHASVVKALKGHDALVASIASTALGLQKKIIDAAVEAGVKRYIPSEFGSDTSNEKTSQLAVCKAKVETREYLEVLSKEEKIEWSGVVNGALLEWGLKVGFLGFNKVAKTARLYDGGDRLFSVSKLADVGRAVAGILAHPVETRNRLVYVHSAVVTQKQLLAIYEKHTGDKWTAVDIDTVELEKQAYEKIGKGEFSGFIDLIHRAVFGEGYGGDFTGKVDNELLGIKEIGDADLEEIVKADLA